MMKESGYKKQRNSLFSRVFIPMVTLVGIIVCIIIGIVFYYNILGQLNDNSRDLFNQQVTNRSRYVENLMISKWSNIESDVAVIQQKINKIIDEKHIAIENLNKSSNQSTLLLSETADDVIAMLRKSGTSGAYLFFSSADDIMDKDVSTPGFFVMDSDPESLYGKENADLMVERCPIQMVTELDIPTNNNWKPKFEFYQEEFDRIGKIFQNFELALTNPDFTIKDVGCWMQPYKISGSDRESITYILPLIYNETIYGAVGIDVSFSYLQKLLPYDELNKAGDSGFVLGLKENDQSYLPLYLNGPAHTQDIKLNQRFKTTGKNIEYLNQSIYCKSEELNLYNSNTPYENEHWVLMGVIQKDQLYSFANHLQGVFISVFVIVLVLGAILSYLLSRYITSPITHLANYIKETSNAFSRVNIERTRIIEIDQLIDAIENMGNDVLEAATRFTNIIKLANTKLAGFEVDYGKKELFITDKFFDIFYLFDVNTENMTIDEFDKMMTVFDQYCNPTQNPNEYLYHIETPNNDVYLRLRYHKSNEKWVGLIEEVSDVVKEKQVIENERDHDILTGLMNRRAFQRKMRKLFILETSRLKVAALIMLDLDNLKEVNDKYGHDCGDSYIKAAAHVFESSTPSEAIVSRTSGDEFYIFLYGFETKEEVEEKIDTLKESIKSTLAHLPNGHDIHILASGGVAWYPDDSLRFEDLQRYSDYAMYSVKHSVKGRIISFNLNDYENNVFVMKKRADFYELIKKKMYTFYFQPIVSARTGEVFGYEALMRSLHLSFYEPREILSMAKIEGQLDMMELISWQDSMKKYNQFYQEGLVSPTAKIFINSISSQLIKANMIHEIERMNPDILDKVVLEVTEGEENSVDTYVEKKLHLQRWNAQIALDDYGTGYNSERNLLLVNPDYVKIDIDIIRDIDKDIDKQKLVENIVSYCHERNKVVIAEGIETYAELKTVVYLHVDFIQGFYFAKAEAIPPQIDIKAKIALLELINQTEKTE